MSAKLDGQIAKLQKQIGDEHARFINAAKVAVVAVLADYGLTLDDLTATKLTKQLATATAHPPKVAKKPKAEKTATASTRMKETKPTKGKRQPAFKGPQPMKYADPNTGAQWSGFGRAPAWIAGEKDRTKFLINGAA